MSHDQKGSPEQGRQRLDEIANSVNRKWGTHMALPLDKAAVARVLRLPFGIFELDWRTAGGFPINRISRLWGKPSSLKSTACLKITRNAQQYCRHCKLPIVYDPISEETDCSCPNPRWTMADPGQFSLLADSEALQIPYGILPDSAEVVSDGLATQMCENPDPEKKKPVEVQYLETDRCEPFRCLYIDTEASIDQAWAHANGVDTKLLMLIGASWAEQVLDLTEELIDTHEFDLIILDSLDMLTPGDTLEKALSTTLKVASKASIMTRCIQKWTAAINSGGLLNRYTPTIVVVCQVRSQNIGKKWASLGPSGGWALGHGVSLDVKLEPKEYEYKGDKAMFGKFGFKVAKSKVGGFPRSTGEFRYWLRAGKKAIGDTEDMETVVEYAKTQGSIKHVGSKWVLLSKFIGEGGKKTFGTLKKLFEFLGENSSVYADLRHTVMSFLIGEDISIVLPSEKLKQEAEKAKKKAGMVTVAQKKAGKKKKVKKSKPEETVEDFLSFVD